MVIETLRYIMWEKGRSKKKELEKLEGKLQIELRITNWRIGKASGKTSN